jgi:hypothetical protein
LSVIDLALVEPDLDLAASFQGIRQVADKRFVLG